MKTLMRLGDHVTGIFAGRRGQNGRIVSRPETDPIAGRCCEVRWEDGSEQLCSTRDLRRTPDPDTLIDVSKL